MFYMKNCKIEQFCFKNLWLKKKSTGTLAIPGFSGIFNFAVCGGVLGGFAHDRGLFSVIFFHFLQKYRCVPKIGFWADIFSSISFIFFRSIVVYLKLGSRLTFLLTFLLTFSLTFWLTFLLTFLLTFCWHFHWHFDWHFYWHFDWHFDWQGGGRSEGRKEWTSS